MFRNKTKLSTDYILLFPIIIVFALTVGALTIAYLQYQSFNKNNQNFLASESEIINDSITQYFSYINHVNNYIGKQIAENGTQDLNFILNLFRTNIELIKKYPNLFSWTGLDWMN